MRLAHNVAVIKAVIATAFKTTVSVEISAKSMLGEVFSVRSLQARCLSNGASFLKYEPLPSRQQHPRNLKPSFFHQQ